MADAGTRCHGCGHARHRPGDCATFYGTEPQKCMCNRGADFAWLVSTLLGVQADHVFRDTTTCICGYKPTTERDWRWHVAGNQAEAVLQAMEGAIV